MQQIRAASKKPTKSADGGVGAFRSVAAHLEAFVLQHFLDCHLLKHPTQTRGMSEVDRDSLQELS